MKCTHPITRFNRIAAWLHELPLLNDRFHDWMPDSWCTAWERVEFDMPCRPCELADDATRPGAPRRP